MAAATVAVLATADVGGESIVVADAHALFRQLAGGKGNPAEYRIDGDKIERRYVSPSGKIRRYELLDRYRLIGGAEASPSLRPDGKTQLRPIEDSGCLSKASRRIGTGRLSSSAICEGSASGRGVTNSGAS